MKKNNVLDVKKIRIVDNNDKIILLISYDNKMTPTEIIKLHLMVPKLKYSWTAL